MTGAVFTNPDFLVLLHLTFTHTLSVYLDKRKENNDYVNCYLFKKKKQLGYLIKLGICSLYFSKECDLRSVWYCTLKAYTYYNILQPHYQVSAGICCCPTTGGNDESIKTCCTRRRLRCCCTVKYKEKISWSGTLLSLMSEDLFILTLWPWNG